MNAIVGVSGFVGQHIARHRSCFGYSSFDIDDLSEKKDLNTIFIAAPSAKKWEVEKDPSKDISNIRQIVNAIKKAKPKRIVYFSTVDVFSPEALQLGPDESCRPDSKSHYGRNRSIFETQLKAPVVQVVRLPGLFGEGLKKNVLFDLKNKNMLDKICLDSEFQWFDMLRFGDLLTELDSCGSGIRHVSVEPIKTRKIVQTYFPDLESECKGETLQSYNLKSVYDYEYEANEALERIGQWFES